MRSSTKKVFFANFEFHVKDDVYEPAEDSFLFAEHLAVNGGDKVIDVGTGCGILGIVAAVKAEQVVAVDINPHALRCAKENATLNRVEQKMFFVLGDLFAAIRSGTRFDIVIFNAPYLPSEGPEASSWVEKAWSGGVSGRKIIDIFLWEAPNYLKCGGAILLMQSTLSGVKETVRNFQEQGLRARVIAEQDLPFFETIVLLKAEFKT